MITIEISTKGIERVLLKHASEVEEAEDFFAYQTIKPRLMAMHAVLRDKFKKPDQLKTIRDNIKNG